MLKRKIEQTLFRMEKYCKSKTSDCERLQTVRKTFSVLDFAHKKL